MGAVHTQLGGLKSAEAARRLAAQGPNRLSKRQFSWLGALWHTANNPLTLLLVGIAVVSGFLGAPADAIIILCVVGLSVSLDASLVSDIKAIIPAVKAQVSASAARAAAANPPAA